jgi:hypothetical protein
MLTGLETGGRSGLSSLLHWLYQGRVFGLIDPALHRSWVTLATILNAFFLSFTVLPGLRLSGTYVGLIITEGKTMIIDGHGHACGEYVTLEKIEAKLNKNKINKVVLFPGEIGSDKIDTIPDGKNKEMLCFSNTIGEFFGRFLNIQSSINFGNQYVYYLRQLCPDLIIQFYWATPKYLDYIESDYKKMKYSGIKLHQCIKYFDIRSDFFHRILEFAEKHSLPIITHLYGKKDALYLIEKI